MHRSHPVDCHVGQRVKFARLAKDMSQTSLGDAVGVTFQQIQKYEKGSNRTSASRLSQFAAKPQSLTPVSALFAGLESP
jgi:transcriptional regulator with XRE-family HTH domain